MDNIRASDWELIKEEYLKLKGNVKLKEFAETQGVKYSTLRSRKNRENWDNKINENVATKSATQQKNVATENKNKNIEKEPMQQEVQEVLNNSELTDKQRLFCIYYIKYFNATKAAIKAGYSKDTSGEQGYQLLQKTSIQSEVKRLKANKLNRAMLSKDDIFQKYIDIAFTDINDFMEFGQKEVPIINPKTGEQIANEDGKLLTYTIDYAHFKDSSEVDGTLISEVSKGKDGAKIKLQDKMKALQWLSDRMELLPTETRIKIDNEKAKVQMAREKLELEKQSKDNSDKDKPIEIVIKRKGEGK